MGKESEIKQAIRNIAAFNSGITLFEATVVESKDTECIIKYQGLELKNVRLVCGFSNSTSTIIIKPAVGSTVLVADLSNGKMRDLVVIMVERAEKITVDSGTKSISKRLDEIENEINILKDIIANWVPVPQDGGAILNTALTTPDDTGKSWSTRKLSKKEGV